MSQERPARRLTRLAGIVARALQPKLDRVLILALIAGTAEAGRIAAWSFADGMAPQPAAYGLVAPFGMAAWLLSIVLLMPLLTLDSIVRPLIGGFISDRATWWANLIYGGYLYGLACVIGSLLEAAKEGFKSEFRSASDRA